MKRRALVSLAALAALLLSTGRASAEEDPGVLLRAGFALAGGPFIMPSVAALGGVGFDAHFGAQFNKWVAAYLCIGGHAVVGEWRGSNLPFGLLVDFTFNDTILVGVGPAFAQVQAKNDELKAEGILGGGRLHIAWQPGDSRTPDGGRKGLFFGFDVSLLFGTPNFVKHLEVFPPVTFPYKPTPMIMPMLSIGYQFAGIF